MEKLNALISECKKAQGQLTIQNSRLLKGDPPPASCGVYALFFNKKCVYFGEAAKGKKGLRNRWKNYRSGDDSHITHKMFLSKFPEKSNRREFIEKNVYMACCVIEDPDLTMAVERALIWIQRPSWNIK